jgi:hypothetical protein
MRYCRARSCWDLSPVPSLVDPGPALIYTSRQEQVLVVQKLIFTFVFCSKRKRELHLLVQLEFSYIYRVETVTFNDKA